MAKGEATVWHNSVYSITWAKVEFVVWRDGCSKSNACERLAAQGMPFTLARGRKPHEPLYAVEWHEGVKHEPYPRVEEWEYEASRGKGESRDGENLRQLYYAAKKKMGTDDRLRKDAELFFEALRDDHEDGFLAGFVDSSKVAPRSEKI